MHNSNNYECLLEAISATELAAKQTIHNFLSILTTRFIYLGTVQTSIDLFIYITYIVKTMYHTKLLMLLVRHLLR